MTGALLGLRRQDAVTRGQGAGLIKVDPCALNAADEVPLTPCAYSTMVLA